MAEYPTDEEIRASFDDGELDRLVKTNIRDDKKIVASLASDTEYGDAWNASVLVAFARLAETLDAEVVTRYQDLTIVRSKKYDEAEHEVMQTRKWRIFSERRDAEIAAEKAAEANSAE